MHDFSVNRLTVFKCVSRNGMLHLMLFLQIILAAGATVALANAVIAKYLLFSSPVVKTSLNFYRGTKNYLSTCGGNKAPAKHRDIQEVIGLK